MKRLVGLTILSAALLTCAAQAQILQGPIRPGDPMISWTVTQRVGVPWSEDPSLLHTGLDLSASRGERVFSMKDGVIAKTGSLGASRRGVSWGSYIVVKNDDRTINGYLHVEIGGTIREGEKVKKGQQIGTVVRDHLHLNACTQVRGCQHGAFPALTFAGKLKSDLGSYFLTPSIR